MHLILCGAGGETEYESRFYDWGRRLKDTLVSKFHLPEDNVSLLVERGDEAGASKISLETIRASLTTFSEKLSGDPGESDLYVYLIGHGSYLRGESKFNIPGPDLTASELEKSIGAARARRIIIINGSSSSAGFINELSGRDRIICTATKSVDEKNATEFMEYFIRALEDGSADENRDERVSVLEVCGRAAELTASWYVENGLIATEHGLIDDNGDALGTRLPISGQDASTSSDGALASATFLRDYSFPAEVPRKLIEEYLGALASVELLKKEKAEMDADKYYEELEALLVKAARANRKIRSFAARREDSCTQQDQGRSIR